MKLCGLCGERPVMVRSNGRPLDRCEECWARERAAPVGTVSTNTRGQVKIKVAKGRWRYLHIVRAEEILGRALRPNERVRWADGDYSNCEPSNLVVETFHRRPLTAEGRPRVRRPRHEIQLGPDEERYWSARAAVSGRTVPQVLLEAARLGDAMLPNPPETA